MANPQLSEVLPQVSVPRIYIDQYDINVFYPKPVAPGPTPCFSLVYDGTSIQNAYLYVTVQGQVQALTTGIFSGGS